MPRERGAWSGAGRRWRLVVEGERPGTWNMGADEAMLEGRADGASPPTLRLYWWSRPTLSLGRFQDASDVDLAACADAGVDVVRRPTGGRAVLHDGELTYSVIASTEDGLPRGVAASYRALCTALVAAYRRLGVRAELTARPRGERSSACYLHATQADVSLGAAKLSGSAQVWRGDACLQHGSLAIVRDTALEARLLGLSGGAARRLADRTASLRDVLGRDVTREEIAEHVAAGFVEALGVSLEPGALTPAEARRAKRPQGAATVGRRPSEQGYLGVPLSLNPGATRRPDPYPRPEA